jgi:hypothetical protein
MVSVENLLLIVNSSCYLAFLELLSQTLQIAGAAEKGIYLKELLLSFTMDTGDISLV